VISWVRRLGAWIGPGRRGSGRRAEPGPVAAPAVRAVDLRITQPLFDQVRAHVEDFRRGEEAGFLICSVARLDDRDILLAREWHPVPDSAIGRNAHGSVLSWSARFNSDILKRAVDLEATPVLVHSHGSPNPRFSPDDRAKERALFAPFSRILGTIPTGTLLLGRGDATASFWTSGRDNELEFRRIVVVGSTIDTWHSATNPPSELEPRRRLDRLTVAIGPESDAKLARAAVAIVGVSGGGSHVFQQLTHHGVGTLIPIDGQLLDETNLGRHVGAEAADIDTTPKTSIAKRLAARVDPAISVIDVNEQFPSPATIAALKGADVVVACLDRFDARVDLSAFCRRYLIPLVDVGMTIQSSGERLAKADGQVIVSLPGKPCLRCFFLTDALLEWERQHRPPGYDRNPDAPGDPQVVSMNGVLASEACNCVLDLITGYSGGRRGARRWQYEGRSGALVPSDLPSRRPRCPGCAQEGHGDPPDALRA
jgi:molybdopterin/thiamine biosynthesis adenylyltransferase